MKTRRIGERRVLIKLHWTVFNYGGFTSCSFIVTSL